MLYFGIFGLVFYKIFVMFSITTLEFIYLQKFPEKHKYLNLGSKMPYLGIFGLEFEKNIVIFEIWNQQARSNLPNYKILPNNKNA